MSASSHLQQQESSHQLDRLCMQCVLPTCPQGAGLQAGQGWLRSGRSGAAPGQWESAPALASCCPAPGDASAAQPHFWTLHSSTSPCTQEPLGSCFRYSKTPNQTKSPAYNIIESKRFSLVKYSAQEAASGWSVRASLLHQPKAENIEPKARFAWCFGLCPQTAWGGKVERLAA